MRFCVLGPLEAYADERSVAVGGGRQRALLALLLVHANEVVSRDRLIEELWAGDPSPSRPQSLDVYLSRLRRAFREVGAGDVLVTRAPGYVLHVEETDARRFEALAAEGREALAAGEAEQATRVLTEALALWRTAYPGGRRALGASRDREARRSCACRPRRTGSTPNWRSGGTPRYVPSSSRW